MFLKYLKYHEPTYPVDIRVCQAALTWQKARHERLQHLADLSATYSTDQGMMFSFQWARETELRYLILRCTGTMFANSI